MPKIAIILARLDLLGPVKVMQNLVNSLKEFDNLEIKVFYFDNVTDEKVRMDVPAVRIERKMFDFSYFDIIHTNGIRPDLFAYLNRKRIKYHISTIHNFVFEDLAFTYNRFVSLIFGKIWLTLWLKADKLVCVSESMKEYYSRWLPAHKMKILYNGIADSDKFTEPDRFFLNVIERFHSRGLKVIGSAGILTKRKGFDMILDLLKDEKGYAYIIIGDGKELSALRKKTEKSKVSDRVFFCGFRNNAADYMSYFDVFAMPSRSEGFGLALVEAVERRTPVICSDLSVFKELFTDEEVTFFKTDNLNSLRKALGEAIESVKSKCEPAYRRYHDNYRAEIMARRYVELYQAVISNQ